MRKLTCIALAAFMLLCAIPFAASAEGNDLPTVPNETFRFELQDGEIVITGFNGQENDTQLAIPDKIGNYYVTAIKAEAFRDKKSLVILQLPNGLKTIGDNAFSGCTDLAVVIMPNTVTSIGKEAFSGDSKLEEIYIPNAATVGSNAFNGCTKLATINCAPLAKPNGWANDWLGNCGAQVSWGRARPSHQHDGKVVGLIPQLGNDPTCVTEGEAMHYHCDKCGKNFSDNLGTMEMPILKIAKLAHEPGDWEIWKVPTKEEEGESVRRCTLCSEIVERRTLPVLVDGILGDANGDGVVNAQDYVYARRAFYGLATLTPEQLTVVDFDRNGQVDSYECVAIKRAIYGLGVLG